MLPKSSLVVSGTPATQSLADLATLKSDLGISDTSQDTRLGRIITMNGAAFSKYCGRQFIKQTYIETWRLPTSPSQYWQAAIPLDPIAALIPTQWPVVSITSIIEGTGALPLDPTLYYNDKPVDPAQRGRGFVRLDSSGAESAWARGTIVATYVAGFDPTGTVSPTSPLPQDLYEAALIDCRARFYAKDKDSSKAVLSEELTDVYRASYAIDGALDKLGGQFGTYGICADALVMLEAYRLPTFAL